MSDDLQKTEGWLIRLRQNWLPFSKYSLLIALGVHAVGFLLFRTVTKDLPDKEPTRPYVTFVSSDSLAKDAKLEEFALLFDSAPLFIPTRWNASRLIEVDFEDVSLEQFAAFEPQIGLLDELRPSSSLISESYPINQPSDLLASRFWRFFTDFDRSADLIQPFELAAPLAEVSVLGAPNSLMIPLPVDLESTTSFLVLRPVSYFVRMSTNGVALGVPILDETSGDDAFDQSVAEWLQGPETLALLPDGYLSVRVFFW